jgi:hypothetical protein
MSLSCGDKVMDCLQRKSARYSRTYKLSYPKNNMDYDIQRADFSHDARQEHSFQDAERRGEAEGGLETLEEERISKTANPMYIHLAFNSGMTIYDEDDDYFYLRGEEKSLTEFLHRVEEWNNREI